MDGFFVAKFKKISNKHTTNKDDSDSKQKKKGKKTEDPEEELIGFNDEADEALIQGTIVFSFFGRQRQY